MKVVCPKIWYSVENFINHCSFYDESTLIFICLIFNFKSLFWNPLWHYVIFNNYNYADYIILYKDIIYILLYILSLYILLLGRIMFTFALEYIYQLFFWVFCFCFILASRLIHPSSPPSKYKHMHCTRLSPIWKL